MIDEKIKNAYAKLAPSEECRQRILENAASGKKAVKSRARIIRLSRMGYAAAACLLVCAVAFFTATGIFSTDRIGIYRNGVLIGDETVIEADTESVEYIGNGVQVARFGAEGQTALQTANGAVTLELHGKNASASVSDGTILVYDEELKSYVDVGRTVEFTKKIEIVWALPEDAQAIYEITVTDGGDSYGIKTFIDPEEGKIKLNTETKEQ